MKLPEEFYLLETSKSETFATWTVYLLPDDPNQDIGINYREAAKYNKQVRLLKCRIVEVVEEQS